MYPFNRDCSLLAHLLSWLLPPMVVQKTVKASTSYAELQTLATKLDRACQKAEFCQLTLEQRQEYIVAFHKFHVFPSHAHATHTLTLTHTHTRTRTRTHTLTHTKHTLTLSPTHFLTITLNQKPAAPSLLLNKTTAQIRGSGAAITKTAPLTRRRRHAHKGDQLTHACMRAVQHQTELSDCSRPYFTCQNAPHITPQISPPQHEHDVLLYPCADQRKGSPGRG